MDNDIDYIKHLQEAFLNVLEDDEDSLIYNMISSIQKVMGCDMCTLWSINYHKATAEGYTDFSSASLLCRIMADNLLYPYVDKADNTNDADFVHTLDNCFIQKVFNLTSHKDQSFYECKIDDCENHRSFNALKGLGLNYFICIPIIKADKIIAFVKLAYKNVPYFSNYCNQDREKIDNNRIKDFSDIINIGITSALSKCISHQKQQLVNDLITNYRRNGNNGLKRILEPAINTIFRKYFEYEGATVFIWNSFSNCYSLLATTGLETHIIAPVSYTEGEGLTGKAAIDKHPAIYDDLIKLEIINDKNYLHKYREKTKHHGKTMLTIPICRPSSSKVIGIIRFTNKVNTCSLRIFEKGLINDYVIDYFNDADIELIDNALHYISLNIDNYLAEEERKDFIAKMSHEMRTPANAIKITADRILKKMGDDRFMRWSFRSYLQSIIDYAQLQIMQSSTNLFLSKSKRSYVIGEYSIRKVIEDCIKIVRPIARDHNVHFENIKIDKDFPVSTFKIDYSAFRIIFYNLLTNAIKYVDPNDAFFVYFFAFESEKSLIIQVFDHGIGIDLKDKDKIFLLGFRGNNAKRSNNEGYGIGLHVVKQIINDFKGTISVNQNRKPTVLEIKLPLNLRSNNN